MKDQKFAKFIVFEGAPNPSVVLNAEIRFITNEDHKYFGKCHIYLDSYYEPVSKHGYMTVNEAMSILQDNGFISVRDDFDQYDIEHLREIKDLIPEKWVYWFNAANEAYK